MLADNAEDPNLAGQAGKFEMHSKLCLPHDREQRRRAKNRATAKTSRDRRKALMQCLQQRVHTLQLKKNCLQQAILQRDEQIMQLKDVTGKSDVLNHRMPYTTQEGCIIKDNAHKSGLGCLSFNASNGSELPSHVDWASRPCKYLEMKQTQHAVVQTPCWNVQAVSAKVIKGIDKPQSTSPKKLCCGREVKCHMQTAREVSCGFEEFCEWVATA